MRLFFCLTLAFLLWADLRAQSLPDRIQSYFDTYQSEYPVEKAYLHFDKHLYGLGEDIWFSAYVMAGSAHTPSPISRPLKVDLFDGAGNLFQSRLIRLENGRGEGNFSLPKYAQAGVYRIVAYTSWMKNFGQEHFFEGEVTVVNPQEKQFLPKVDFSEIKTENGKTNYKTELLIVDYNGQPLSNKRIRLVLKTAQDVISDKEILLNQDGEAKFSLETLATAYSSQYIEIMVLEEETFGITQSVRLPYSLEFADIQFLPEGGNLVEGKKNNIAFRGIYPDGTPVTFNGKILEDSLITFESNFAGLGKFQLNPKKGPYRAEITNPATGESKIVDLPVAAKEGLCLQVVNNPKASYVTAFIQGTEGFGKLLLVSQTRGILNYMIQGELQNGVWGARIPKENLISGINNITITQEDGKPLAERKFFYISENDVMDLSLEVKGELHKRSKIEVEIESLWAESANPGSFSFSVLDADQVELSDIHDNIFSSFLISSDLKGSVFQPGQYFRSDGQVDIEALDLVMLTHGWSRFEWEHILSETYPKIENFIERGINIEGQVSKRIETFSRLKGGVINAIVGEGIEIQSAPFGSDGRFMFTEMDYMDTATVTITAKDKRLRNYLNIEIVYPEPAISNLEGKFGSEVVWPESLMASILERRRLVDEMLTDSKIMDLEGVTVEAQSIQSEFEAKLAYGYGDQSLNVDSIPGATNFRSVVELINGRVDGLRSRAKGGGVEILLKSPYSFLSGDDGTTPKILLDNTPVAPETLLSVNIRDVQSIEVFTNPARLGQFGIFEGSGVIAVYLKPGASGFGKGGTLVTQYGGYSSVKKFYEPMYDQMVERKALLDNRSTIFWKGQVETDAEGKATLEYFNNDIAKSQILVLEGIDSQGRLGRFVTQIGSN